MKRFTRIPLILSISRSKMVFKLIQPQKPRTNPAESIELTPNYPEPIIGSGMRNQVFRLKLKLRIKN